MRRRSPRRLLGVLAAVTVAFSLFSSASTAGAAPAATTAATSTAQAGTAVQPLSTSTPVVFVHGYTGNASNWVTAMSVFQLNGWSSSKLFAYEYNSYGNNITNAQGLASFVDNVKSRTGASKVAIVNHSMGGLVSQYYLKVLGGNTSVSHLASIAGANHGTTFASACLIYTTCQQMYPGSSFISQITSGDETPGDTKYATWYSACDGVILPYTSTRLTGATNNLVACQTHIGFLADTIVLGQIARFAAS
ncbi:MULTISPECIES: triacylglycerol lipase [Streptomyces]|uniref:Alpha/beta fold hydrolase n=1 Tax=Streptomyces glycanivorans TaxID=3033808 RepID=A0ABY9JDQ4_9ACTN|nr:MULTISPECIES: alpha/beta fold hydrolase [unclassified Streptomyces]WSQ77882.1 alpha/beta fold hydrolase [Streptomyces sp. NBC_01213]TXS05231.1 alpha/beta hydrolase [Streptomyces sp. wa22]WLQ64498.1 alpha/beta fold hydrolase [Streptomyces sp. Alt3]WSQ85254.1 alpha/beta fold hydrolase [Streptomyces sp. NBC_01212]WSR08657.1 alpha/beta fold hydrolase [Streptomyces sp. NBC_01208]